MLKILRSYTSAAPLVVFRIAFGTMLFLSIIRFWRKGWIEDLYIKPKYFFPFYGFEFIKPLGEYTYFLFAVCAICALLVALGLFYRIASIGLFLTFTYIELIDKSTYLNHYYFVSVISFMLIFLPANAYFSFDAYRNKNFQTDQIPVWCIFVIKAMVCILYFYAGVAKLNSDWLLNALPLKIWLPAKNDMPVIGFLFNYKWIPYVFSWFGCFYDLSIPFFLWNKKTRPFAFIAVVIFHGLTAILFPIGMFPYIMIVTALIFFSGPFHQNIINRLGGILGLKVSFLKNDKKYVYNQLTSNIASTVFSIFFLIQLVLPFRYLAYPDELFWTEEGYRFSWRVMLMEKAGYTQFQIKDKTGKTLIVNNNLFLTTLQEKAMSTQPDMILQYAHILRDYYSRHGFKNPEVYVDSYVALNGRLGKPLVNPEVNLAAETESFQHKFWITHFDNEIKGF
ncbi:HTTM domain-containing protein [Dyadobacter sp. 3J3]|uniref:HTTM domain-containing protein n=1 Tax=Dyadobacter sp. 3J3 TaxID=2606600 RepID=UPI00135BF2DA|nr:HTTM domain-containing protein [Dyadobacter sp. 3J3]